ncbi:Abi family protein [Geobacter anodireducens]
MRYAKLPLAITEQSKRLSERGLLFDDPQRVEKYLSNIGYYRLSAYWHPFELPSFNGNSRNHQFKPNTTFDQVLHLYIFDRKLRLLVMEAIERIEVAVRTRWATALALRHGSHAHMRAELFKDPWQHTSDLAKIAAELGKSTETFVTHYKKQYKEPFLPPIWAIVETMSLGTLSRWFKNTSDTATKKEVSLALNMPTIEILEQVLHALTPVRNVCAHHGRLWNRRFAMSLPVIKRIRERLVPPDAPHHQDHHLYNYLVVVDALMKAVSPGSTWTQRLMTLADVLDGAGHRSMGFPEDWRERQPWKLA